MCKFEEQIMIISLGTNMMKHTVTVVMLYILLNFQNFNAQRVKRKVVFNENSKFFIRLNGKTNVLNATGIFAHGWAIRINYDLPDTVPKLHKIFKRSLENNETSTIATTCISKQICDMFKVENIRTCGIFCGLRNIIYGSEGLQAEFFQNFLNSCSNHVD